MLRHKKLVNVGDQQRSAASSNNNRSRPQSRGHHQEKQPRGDGSNQQQATRQQHFGARSSDTHINQPDDGLEDDDELEDKLWRQAARMLTDEHELLQRATPARPPSSTAAAAAANQRGRSNTPESQAATGAGGDTLATVDDDNSSISFAQSGCHSILSAWRLKSANRGSSRHSQRPVSVLSNASSAGKRSAASTAFTARGKSPASQTRIPLGPRQAQHFVTNTRRRRRANELILSTLEARRRALELNRQNASLFGSGSYLAANLEDDEATAATTMLPPFDAARLSLSPSPVARKTPSPAPRRPAMSDLGGRISSSPSTAAQAQRQRLLATAVGRQQRPLAAAAAAAATQRRRRGQQPPLAKLDQNSSDLYSSNDSSSGSESSSSSSSSSGSQFTQLVTSELALDEQALRLDAGGAAVHHLPGRPLYSQRRADQQRAPQQPLRRMASSPLQQQPPAPPQVPERTRRKASNTQSDAQKPSSQARSPATPVERQTMIRRRASEAENEQDGEDEADEDEETEALDRAGGGKLRRGALRRDSIRRLRLNRASSSPSRARSPSSGGHRDPSSSDSSPRVSSRKQQQQQQLSSARRRDIENNPFLNRHHFRTTSARARSSSGGDGSRVDGSVLATGERHRNLLQDDESLEEPDRRRHSWRPLSGGGARLASPATREVIVNAEAPSERRLLAGSSSSSSRPARRSNSSETIGREVGAAGRTLAAGSNKVSKQQQQQQQREHQQQQQHDEQEESNIRQVERMLRQMRPNQVFTSYAKESSSIRSQSTSRGGDNGAPPQQQQHQSFEHVKSSTVPTGGSTSTTKAASELRGATGAGRHRRQPSPVVVREGARSRDDLKFDAMGNRKQYELQERWRHEKTGSRDGGADRGEVVSERRVDERVEFLRSSSISPPVEFADPTSGWSKRPAAATTTAADTSTNLFHRAANLKRAVVAPPVQLRSSSRPTSPPSSSATAAATGKQQPEADVWRTTTKMVTASIAPTATRRSLSEERTTTAARNRRLLEQQQQQQQQQYQPLQTQKAYHHHHPQRQQQESQPLTPLTSAANRASLSTGGTAQVAGAKRPGAQEPSERQQQRERQVSHHLQQADSLPKFERTADDEFRKRVDYLRKMARANLAGDELAPRSRSSSLATRAGGQESAAARDRTAPSSTIGAAPIPLRPKPMSTNWRLDGGPAASSSTSPPPILSPKPRLVVEHDQRRAASSTIGLLDGGPAASSSTSPPPILSPKPRLVVEHDQRRAASSTIGLLENEPRARWNLARGLAAESPDSSATAKRSHTATTTNLDALLAADRYQSREQLSLIGAGPAGTKWRRSNSSLASLSSQQQQQHGAAHNSSSAQFVAAHRQPQYTRPTSPGQVLGGGSGTRGSTGTSETTRTSAATTSSQRPLLSGLLTSQPRPTSPTSSHLSSASTARSHPRAELTSSAVVKLVVKEKSAPKLDYAFVEQQQHQQQEQEQHQYQRQKPLQPTSRNQIYHHALTATPGQPTTINSAPKITPSTKPTIGQQQSTTLAGTRQLLTTSATSINRSKSPPRVTSPRSPEFGAMAASSNDDSAIASSVSSPSLSFMMNTATDQPQQQQQQQSSASASSVGRSASPMGPVYGQAARSQQQQAQHQQQAPLTGLRMKPTTAAAAVGEMSSSGASSGSSPSSVALQSILRRHQQQQQQHIHQQQQHSGESSDSSAMNVAASRRQQQCGSPVSQVDQSSSSGIGSGNMKRMHSSSQGTHSSSQRLDTCSPEPAASRRPLSPTGGGGGGQCQSDSDSQQRQQQQQQQPSSSPPKRVHFNDRTSIRSFESISSLASNSTAVPNELMRQQIGSPDSMGSGSTSRLSADSPDLRGRNSGAAIYAIRGDPELELEQTTPTSPAGGPGLSGGGGGMASFQRQQQPLLHSPQASASYTMTPGQAQGQAAIAASGARYVPGQAAQLGYEPAMLVHASSAGLMHQPQQQPVGAFLRMTAPPTISTSPMNSPQQQHQHQQPPAHIHYIVRPTSLTSTHIMPVVSKAPTVQPAAADDDDDPNYAHRLRQAATSRVFGGYVGPTSAGAQVSPPIAPAHNQQQQHQPRHQYQYGQQQYGQQQQQPQRPVRRPPDLLNFQTEV